MGYSPYDLRELDTTKAATHTYTRGQTAQSSSNLQIVVKIVPTSFYQASFTSIKQIYISLYVYASAFLILPWAQLYHCNSSLMNESNKIFDTCPFFICMSHDFKNIII